MIDTYGMFDDDVWKVIQPEDIWVYNKLQIARMQNINCGPAGVRVPTDGQYIVRPMINLLGMSVGAEIKHLTRDSLLDVPPGYFWCEILEGTQVSVDYNNGNLVGVYQPERYMDSPLYKFSKWTRLNTGPEIPVWLKPLVSKYSRINVEYIGDKVIEVHLRNSPDPEVQEIIPVWESEPTTTRKGYRFVDDYDDGDGFLKEARLGFLIKE